MNNVHVLDCDSLIPRLLSDRCINMAEVELYYSGGFKALSGQTVVNGTI